MSETPEASGPAGPGAVERLTRDDVERKKFLKMVGKGVGAASAASAFGVFLSACGSSSSKSSTSTPAASTPTSTGAQGGPGDLAIVNYALTLEYLETEFYRAVASSGLFKGKVLSVIKTFGSQERQHVLALKKVAASLGTPAPRPNGKFPLTSAASVTKLAATVENLGAAAYLGQAASIQSTEILAAALAIHTVEARHAATLNGLLGKSPTPDGAFGKPATMEQVLAAVKPFIVTA